MAKRHALLELEDTQGNESTDATVFTKKFYLPEIEAGVNPGPQPLDRSDEQRGIDGRQKLAQNEYQPDGTIVMRNYVNYTGALLMILFGDVTSTPGDGIITDPDGGMIPVGATRHVFKKLAGVRPKSGRLALHYGGTNWLQARGVTMTDLAFSLDEDGVKETATLMANYLKRLTVEPTGGEPADYDNFDILPLRRRNVTVDWGVGTEEIDTIAFTFAQALEYVRNLGTASGWPTDTQRANSPDGFLALTGNLTRRQFDNDDWDALIAADAFAVTIRAISEQHIGATSYPYSMWVEAPGAQFAGGTPETLKNQARHSFDFDWVAGYDSTAGTDFTVTLVDGVTAYKA